ncbi:hypothetical protein NMG60_11034681 [Bertholletia excelsa]
MQIGHPTDVKHVAHIGWDGHNVDSPPSWMKEFKSPQGFHSAPLCLGGEPRGTPDVKSISGEPRRSMRRLKDSEANDSSELPKSSRRHFSGDGSSSEHHARDPTKSRSKKSSSDGSKHTRKPKVSALGSESPSANLPEIPKKSRRKKAKDPENVELSRISKSTPDDSEPNTESTRSSFSQSSTFEAQTGR